MEKIWSKSYEAGTDALPDLNQYKNVNEIFSVSCDKYADRSAFHNMGTTLTFAQMNNYVERLASYFQNELGLKKGDRIALMMPNLLQYPICIFAALRAGLIVVNVNPLYTATELKHQLKDSGAETIVLFENAAHNLEKIIDETEIKNVILTRIGDFLKFPKSVIVNFVIKHIKKMVPKWKLDNFVCLNNIFKEDYGRLTHVEVDREDIAFLQYTGGTTGVSKGAMLTHGNITSNMIQARAWIEKLVSADGDIIITPLPLYHIFSLTANCLVFSSVGALNILITNPRDFDGFIKELSKWKFTAFTGVNTLYNALLNHPKFKDLDFSSLKLSLGGGMAVQKAVADKWKEVTKTPLIEAYGLTETSPAACLNPMNLKEFNGFIGIPISHTDVKIIDEDGKELEFGEVGEIAIKGPQVMKGYWNRPDETAKVMTDDGFFRTGDMATMNQEGFVKIVDRKKDMILVSGFNVYPNEIEDVISTMEGVLESAAVGIPDDKSGEVVKVFAVLKDKSITAEDIINHCREHLTNYKVPKQVEFRDELPKTNVGKILRRKLRE